MHVGNLLKYVRLNSYDWLKNVLSATIHLINAYGIRKFARNGACISSEPAGPDRRGVICPRRDLARFFFSQPSWVGYKENWAAFIDILLLGSNIEFNYCLLAHLVINIEELINSANLTYPMWRRLGPAFSLHFFLLLWGPGVKSWASSVVDKNLSGQSFWK